jgi:hypothetical protein
MSRITPTIPASSLNALLNVDSNENMTYCNYFISQEIKREF